jgi:hypothetical protein
MVIQAGSWVEVRSREEILRTLDSRGRLDGLPFMPQMLDYCGRRFRVYRSAHKTCDTASRTGARRLEDGVHLENLRCDGIAYGGCQAACLLFWKTAWVKPVEGPSPADRPLVSASRPAASHDNAKAIHAGVLAADQPASGGPVYSCQATELPHFTTSRKWWEARQLIDDYQSANVSLLELLRGSVYAVISHFIRPRHGRLDPLRNAGRVLYDTVARILGARPFPRRLGALPAGSRAPIVNLNLVPGEMVRVKPVEEILRSIDTNCKNNGLLFDAEMVPNCGKVFRVKSRVSTFIDESTGRMVSLKTPAVILEGVWCGSHYSEHCMFCPRSIYSWWREAWLERIDDAVARPSAAMAETSSRPDPVSGVRPAIEYHN